MVNFLVYIRKIQRFNDEFGHCFPSCSIVTDERLIKWTEMIRSGEFSLTANDREQLVDLGFEFDPKQAEWMNFYFWAYDLKRKRGSCDINSWETALLPLREWLGFQKTNYQKDTLTDDRVLLLQKLNLQFYKDRAKLLSDQWEEKFEQLSTFIKEQNAIPASARRSKTEKILYKWVEAQRKKESIGKLSSDKLVKLQSLGILFKKEIEALREQIWLSRYQELKQFYALHGHSKVNAGYNRSLYNWVLRQAESIDKLSKEKRIKLVRLRFEFKISKQRISVSAKNLIENLEEKPLLISPYTVPKI